jgi:hypothetical protein
MRIRIWMLLLVKVMSICNHRSYIPFGLHYEPHLRAFPEGVICPPRLQFEPLKLLNFDFLRTRIRIQLFTLMLIRIQFKEKCASIRVRIYNPGLSKGLEFKVYHTMAAFFGA